MYELSPEAINKAVQQVTEKALQTVYTQSDVYLTHQVNRYFGQENFNKFENEIVKNGIAQLSNYAQYQLMPWMVKEIQSQLPQLIANEIQRQLPKLLDSVIQQLNARVSTDKAESQPYNPASGAAKGNNVHAVSHYEYEPSRKDEIDFNHYVQDYNNLQKIEGFRKNQTIEEFCHKWRIEKFKCINDAEKLQDSEIPPRFKSADDGYFWAVSLDKAGYYMVLPQVYITYESTKHHTMGFKEAFKSGYTSGTFYFSPKLPAVFRKDSNTWTIVRKGELRLDPM